MKIGHAWKAAFLSLKFLSFAPLVGGQQTPHQGHLLFLLQQGEHEQALNIYQKEVQAHGEHDIELLHQMGLRILDHGFRQRNPECQLLALFGAAISAHEEAYYILEESLRSPYIPIQLVALGALASFQNDRADQALLRALGSPAFQVRYEAVYQLCKKKHLQAATQAESLMYKSPEALMTVFPPLFAMLEDRHSTRILRRLLNQPSQDVRLAVVLSLAKYQREDLLPQIRQQSSQLHFALQEAAAYACGSLGDETSIPKLQRLALSQYPTVALAAHLALYQLGDEESIKAIEEMAERGDLFAIAALGDIPDRPRLLLELLENPRLHIRFNAWISLLKQHHPEALESMEDFLIRDQKDLAFTLYESPGHVFKAWKVTSSASQLLKEDVKAYHHHLELKESILEKVRHLSEQRFIALAHQIFLKQQRDLIPRTVALLEALGTEQAIECLKEHQQQLGAPFVRHYCLLALYRLKAAGPYADQLCQWVKERGLTEFIRFQPFSPWEWGQHSYTLTPEETSKLLIEVFEAFTLQQEIRGVEMLIEAMATGHPKNKYALAGLLLRAIE